jgi:hypothetical protein
MCGRAIRCVTNVACEAVCSVIVNFFCYRPIYACVDILFNQCRKLWTDSINENQVAVYPGNVPVPAQIVHNNDFGLVPVIGDNHDDLV